MRSKASIEKALSDAGARAVRFGRDGWSSLTEDGTVNDCIVEFVWPVGEGLAKVRLVTHPLAPTNTGYKTTSIGPEQRERQAWRALAWYIETMLKAAQFGLMRFEEVFLAFIVDPKTDRTLGDSLIPQIESGAAALLEAAK